jgi:hypothetical protein
MKIAEKFESIRVCDDEKARRVLNVSKKRANISADEIEKGVTIERLADIGVPVFRYSTQVTIHGVIPDFDPASRPLGYKAVFQNENGSLGVKYVAIDGAKKALIVKAARLCGAKDKFSAHINCKGLELVLQTFDKESAIAAFKSFPKDLIIGGVYAARGVFGEFYVIADIGAIEQQNLFPLIGKLYGFNSEPELAAAQAAQDAEYAAKRAESEKHWEQVRVEREAAEAKARAEAVASLAVSHKPLSQVPAGEFDFITVTNDGRAFFYVVRKKGFGLCCASVKYVPGIDASAIDCSQKMKAWKDKLPMIQQRAAAGQVFAA